jgi:hypothetical protein
VRSVDGIFQVVRAFDDDEVTHVEGDVNPIRDMEIIQTELRLKDIEWVQKQLESNKKSTRSLGNNSLADKARKEEIVRDLSVSSSLSCMLTNPRRQQKRYSRCFLKKTRMSGKLNGRIRRYALFHPPALSAAAQRSKWTSGMPTLSTLEDISVPNRSVSSFSRGF